jgi:hypothetical protein
MAENQNTKTVEARYAQVSTGVDVNLIEGCHDVMLNHDAGLLPGKLTTLSAAQARELATDLVDQAYEADKRNGVEPQLDAVEFHAAVASVEEFLQTALDRDDMSLAEIAASVTAIARGQG